MQIIIYFPRLYALRRVFVSGFKMTNGDLFLGDTHQIVNCFLPGVMIRKLTDFLPLLLVVVSFFVCFKYLNFSWAELDL